MVRCMKDCAFLCADRNGEESINSGSLDSGIDQILNNELHLRDVCIHSYVLLPLLSTVTVLIKYRSLTISSFSHTVVIKLMYSQHLM